jgi:hypothetical protein
MKKQISFHDTNKMMARASTHDVLEVHQDHARRLEHDNQDKGAPQDDVTCGEGDYLSMPPPPRSVHRQGSKELLRDIEQGKVEISLPTQEAMADWIHRRWTNLHRLVAAPPGTSSLDRASQGALSGVSGRRTEAPRALPSSAETSSVEDHRDDQEVLGDDDSRMKCQAIVDPDDHPSRNHQFERSRRESRGRLKDTAGTFQENWRHNSHKREQLEAGCSHQDISPRQQPQAFRVENDEEDFERNHRSDYEMASVFNSDRRRKHMREASFNSKCSSQVTRDEIPEFRHESRSVHTRDVSCSSPFKKRRRIAETATKRLSTVTTTFKDIIGHQAVKLRMDEVLLPLALPSALSKAILQGIRAYSPSLLLYGPPGCGSKLSSYACDLFLDQVDCCFSSLS